jgi:PKD repeat protein
MHRELFGGSVHRLGVRWPIAPLTIALLAGVGALILPMAAATPVPSDFGVTLTATPANGTAPLLVQFHTTVSVGTPTWYAWSFGDNEFLNGSTQSNVPHQYLFAGHFTAAVLVSEGPIMHSASILISVKPGPLTLSIAATPTAGVVPVTVQFEGFPSGGTGTYSTVQWLFGDGASAATLDLVHTYSTAGHYRASLTVTDSAGARTAAYVWVNLTLPGTPNTGASTTPTLGAAGVIPMAVSAAGASGLVALSIAFHPGMRGRPRRAEPPPGAETEYLPAAIGFVLGSRDLGLSATSAAAASSTPTTTVVREPSDAPSGETNRPFRTFEQRGPLPALTAVVPFDSPRPVAPIDNGAAGEEPKQLSSRLVVYLSQLGALRDDDVPTVDWTQFGMSERLGARQNVISNVLRRLVSAGVVEEDLRHVQRQPRRLKVYRLTPRGEALARDLRFGGRSENGHAADRFLSNGNESTGRDDRPADRTARRRAT